MIQTYFTIRLKQFFRSLKKPLNLIGFLFVLLGIGFYGFGLGFIVAHAGEAGLEEFSKDAIEKMVIGFTAIVTILRMFRPTYMPMRETLMSYQPVSPFKRYLFSVIADFQNVFFFLGLYFILVALFFSGSQGIVLFFAVLLTLSGCHFVRRSLQYPIDFRINLKIVPFLLVVMIAVMGAPWIYETIWFLPYLILLNGLLFWIGYVFDQSKVGRKLRKTTKKEKNRSMAFKMLLNNKNVRVPLIMGFVFKFIFLGAILVMQYTGEEDPLLGVRYFWLFIASTFVFTYVFNNIWGFWRSAWLNFEIRSGNLKNMFLFYWQTIRYLLLFDFLITMSTCYFINHDFMIIGIFYFTTLLTMLFTAFLWSILFPKFINHAMPKKGSTSYWSIAFVMVSVIGLSFIERGSISFLLVPLFLILAIIGLIISIKIYPEKKYSMFSKLFRSE